MINRVTENMKYTTLTNSLFNVQGKAANLMEKISTQKNINRPSDDPIGASKSLNYTSTLASIYQYQINVTSAQTWLSLTDTSLESIKDLIAEAEDIAIGVTDETMESNEAIVSSLIDETLSLMNTKSGNSYLFGGSKTDVAPFLSTTATANIGTASALTSNTFNGTVTSGGAYTGVVDKTYKVKIIDGGTLDEATYQVSDDGGATWGATSAAGDLATGTITLGDGITMTFAPNTLDPADFAADDLFSVAAAPSIVGSASATTVNTFNGTVTSGGAYTGVIDKTYKVKIIDGGTLDEATYQVSDDGGATWGATSAAGDLATGTITLGDGITMTFAPNTVNPADLAADDLFSVSATAIPSVIGSASATTVNTFNGTVTSGGTYTGTSDKTYKVKIIDGGALNVATYQVSDDGGATWGATSAAGDLATGTITLGEGITMTFTPNTVNPTDLAADDLFSVAAASSVIGSSSATTVNTFNGTVTSGGTYTGTSDKTYKVKIIDGGTLNVATYQVSDDGGATWGATSAAGDLATGTITLGEGITMTFTPNTLDPADLAANDLFSVSAAPDAASIGAAFASTANTFNGTVTSGGTNTGTENKTYAVKIVTGGTLATTTYKISADGGRTWGATSAAGDLATGTITVGDGITMTFAGGTQDLATDDLFTVNGYVGGYYRGNDDQLTVEVGKNNHFAYNINGADAFTAANGPVASASIVGAGAGLTEDDTITLSRGSSVGSWTLTGNAKYPDMVITSMSAANVSIDADGDGTVDINLDLSGKWSSDNTASFSITAGTVPQVSKVAVSGTGTVDLLTTLNALKNALHDHDLTAVNALADDLGVAQTQVLQAQTKAGAKASSLEITSTNLTAFNEQITSLKSGIDDIDLAELIVSYQMEQTAMEASYNMAAKIGKMTILDYL